MAKRMERLNLIIPGADKLALLRCAEVDGEALSVLVRKFLRDGLARRGYLATGDSQPAQPFDMQGGPTWNS